VSTTPVLGAYEHVLLTTIESVLLGVLLQKRVHHIYRDGHLLRDLSRRRGKYRVILHDVVGVSPAAMALTLALIIDH
jgi:hypothetical protein